jgi:hypothetical protein
MKGLIMSKLLGLIKALLPGFVSSQERDEMYLAQAHDACDLERRMRELDHRARYASLGPQWSNGAW